MVLAGGVSLLRGLDERLRQETSVPVHVAEEPMACVVMGSGSFLEEIEFDRGALSSG
jgi:rod shape-determining protein MreB and related proteins